MGKLFVTLSILLTTLTSHSCGTIDSEKQDASSLTETKDRIEWVYECDRGFLGIYRWMYRNFS